MMRGRELTARTIAPKCKLALSISEEINCISRTFWSSTASMDPSTSECLIYRLSFPECVISRIDVVPFKAVFQAGYSYQLLLLLVLTTFFRLPVYAPQFIRVSVGFTPNLNEMYYHSKILPVSNRNETISIRFDEEFVFGEYVRLDLFGRYQKQPLDQLFYTVLQSVRCFGTPLIHPVINQFAAMKLENISKLAATCFPRRPRCECTHYTVRPTPDDMQESMRNRVLKHLEAGRLGLACNIIANSADYHGLRNPSTLTYLSTKWRDSAEFVNEYAKELCSNATHFLPFEALMFARIFNSSDYLLDRAISQDLIEPTEELGDLLLERGFEAEALEIYSEGHHQQKVFYSYYFSPVI